MLECYIWFVGSSIVCVNTSVKMVSITTAVCIDKNRGKSRKPWYPCCVVETDGMSWITLAKYGSTWSEWYKFLEVSRTHPMALWDRTWARTLPSYYV